MTDKQSENCKETSRVIIVLRAPKTISLRQVQLMAPLSIPELRVTFVVLRATEGSLRTSTCSLQTPPSATFCYSTCAELAACRRATGSRLSATNAHPRAASPCQRPDHRDEQIPGCTIVFGTLHSSKFIRISVRVAISTVINSVGHQPSSAGACFVLRHLQCCRCLLCLVFRLGATTDRTTHSGPDPFVWHLQRSIPMIW